jgi:hypothetical protein
VLARPQMRMRMRASQQPSASFGPWGDGVEDKGSGGPFALKERICASLDSLQGRRQRERLGL